MNRLFNLGVVVALLANLSNFQAANGALDPMRAQDKTIPQTVIIQLAEGLTIEEDPQPGQGRRFKTQSEELNEALKELDVRSVKPLFPPGQIHKLADSGKLEDEFTRTYLLRFKKSTDIEAALPFLALLEDVAFVEHDYYADTLDIETPNDPRYTDQWALTAIGAPAAWAQLPADSPTVTVAVIDSGICADHPDLTGRILSGWDFLESDDAPQDEFGHGCAVSGVIAANVNNGAGIAGIAPNAEIMPLRVLNASGVGSFSDVSSAIVYAADHGAQVINLSLGGASPSMLLESAVNYALTKGVVVIASAGNSGKEGVLYPAAYPGVTAVGSLDQNLQHSSFSNYGPEVDIWAPGRDILSTGLDDTYVTMSGSSLAAPFVAGARAMEIALDIKLTADSDILSFDLQPNATPTPDPEVTTTPTYTPIPTIAPTENAADTSTAGGGLFYRAQVLMNHPADSERLADWGIKILDNGFQTAVVQATQEQLARLARLGFAPTQIDSVEYMLAVQSASNGAALSISEVVSSSAEMMALASVDSDSDGLTDTEETWWCTNPNDNNSDSALAPSPGNPSDGDEVQAILNGITSYGPPFALWPQFTPHNPNGNCPDGDFDAVPDSAEEYILGSSILRESTDLDKFDDGQEFFGRTYCPAPSGPCGYGILPRAEDSAYVSSLLPSFVLAPGNDPFVAAFPEPQVEVEPSSIVMTQKTIITNTKGTTVGTEKTYGTSKTNGTSTSLANTITWNTWQEVSHTTTDNQANAQELTLSAIGLTALTICGIVDIGVDFFSRPEFSCGKMLRKAADGTVWAVQTYFEQQRQLIDQILNSDADPWQKALQLELITDCSLNNLSATEVNYCPANGVRVASNQSYIDLQSPATNVQNNLSSANGNYLSTDGLTSLSVRPFHSAAIPLYTLPTTTVSSGSEHGGAQTTTSTEYEEQTISESSTNQYSDNWSIATAVDSTHAADLRFTYSVVNNGTEYAREVTNLTFNIYIGNNPNPIETYVAINGTTKPKIQNIFPGESVTYTSEEILLTLDEMRAIDEGASIRIVMEDISFGDDQVFYQDALNGSVLLAMEDGFDDNDETIDSFLIPVWDPNDTVQDVAKRYFPVTEDAEGNLLSISTPEFNHPNPPTFVEHSLTGTSWWNIYLSEGLTYVDAFKDTVASPNSSVLIRIVTDSDLDGYNNRNEIRIGTDPDDPASHPSPVMVAGYTKSFTGNDCTVRMVFQNLGNYDAYGVEAILYTPDGQVNITNNTIGGSGRVNAGEKVIVSASDTFQYTKSVPSPKEPVIVVSYNDPQGNHRFILPAGALLSTLNDDIAPLNGQMLPDPGVDIASTSATNANFVIFSPHAETITNGKLFVEYIDGQGNVMHEDVFTQDFASGPTVVPVSINTSTYPPESTILLAFFTDSQGDIIDSSARPLASFGADPLPEANVTTSDIEVGAQGVVEVPNPWNFGTVERGTTLYANITLGNTGLGDLRYSLSGWGNGVSVMGVPSGSLSPSDTRQFAITIDTAGLPNGAFSKTLTLRTNDPNHAIITINLTGTIGTPAGTATAYQVNPYQPWNQFVYVPGPHNQNDMVNFTHTLADDPSRMFPLYLYDEDGSTLKGVGEYGVDFSGQTVPFGVFGTGADLDLNVANGETKYTDNTRSAVSSTANSGQTNITLSSASGFAAGQEVLIIQIQGTGAGNYEFANIGSIASNTLTLTKNLTNAYTVGGSSKAQVIRVMQYHDVTVQTGGVLTAHAWDGNSGGIVAFRSSGTVNILGSLRATGIGFRGGQTEQVSNSYGYGGEGVSGTSGSGGNGTGANPSGGGGNIDNSLGGNSQQFFTGGGGSGRAQSYQGDESGGGGGGGGHVYGGGGGASGVDSNTAGQPGGLATGTGGGHGGDDLNNFGNGIGAGGNAGGISTGGDQYSGVGGSGHSNRSPGGGGGGANYPDASDGSRMIFGGGGGAGSRYEPYGGGHNSPGGSGGGLVIAFARTINVSGTISANGAQGVCGSARDGCGGSGAGGYIYIKSAQATLGSSLVTALGGSRTGPTQYGGGGGAGSIGRIRIEYGTISGSANPPASLQQVNYYSITGQGAPFGVFGNGSDGNLTVSTGQTVYTDNIRTALASTATAGQTNITVSNATDFAVGKEVLIIQIQGTGAGSYEFAGITNVSGNTITLSNPLGKTYTTGGNSKAQVIVVPNYQIVTVQSGGVLTAHAWDGNTGGVVALRASDTVAVYGAIDVTGKGFHGGFGGNVEGGGAYQGEGIFGSGTRSTSSNGNGGGGGGNQGSGGGGGNGVAGFSAIGGTPGGGGISTGTNDLTNMVIGGGGGGWFENPSSTGSGGNGGGIIFIASFNIITTGSIVSNGNDTSSGSWGSGGGGAGGSILLKSQTVVLGTALVRATGGIAGNSTYPRDGGNGGAGRIRIEYGSFSGTTIPVASSQQVNYYNLTGSSSNTLYVPDNINNGSYARYKLLYGQRSLNTAGGDQLYNVYLENRQYSSVTLSALVERVAGSGSTFNFCLDFGNNGTCDYPANSQEFTGPVRLDSSNLASALNAYITGLGSTAPILTIPIRVNISTPADVFLFNLSSTAISGVDLQPSTPGIAPHNGNAANNILEGSLVDLSATVTNNGSHEASDFIVAFYLGDPANGGTLIGSKFISSLAPGVTSPVQTVTWNTSGLLGSKTVYVKVDSSNAIGESNESNNTSSAPAVIKKKPDLTILDLQAPDLRAGETGSASVTVKNDGQFDATGAVVRLYLGTGTNGTVLGYVTINVPQGQSVNAQIPFSIGTPGSKNLFAKADPDNVITEANEQNNTRAGSTNIGWNLLTVDAGGANDTTYSSGAGYGWLTQGTAITTCGTQLQQSYRQAGSTETLQYRFDNLLPGRYYHLDLTFATCTGERYLDMFVDGTQMIETQAGALPGTGNLPVYVNSTPQTISLLLDPASYESDGSVTLSISRNSGLNGPLVNIIDLQEVKYCYMDSGPNEAPWSSSNDCGYDPSWSSDSFNGWGTLPYETMRFGDDSVKYKFTNLIPAKKYNLHMVYYEDDSAARIQRVSFDGSPAGGLFTLGPTPMRYILPIPASSYADGQLIVGIERPGGGEAIISEITVEEDSRLENNRYNTPPAAFNKSAPSNGLTNQSVNPTLSWAASSGATSYEYCYDTTNDNSCSNWTGNGLSTSKALSGLEKGVAYFWHVRALKGSTITYSNGGSTSFWSFTTVADPNGAFNKSNPLDGSTTEPNNPTLNWGISNGATLYEYCYDTTNDNACSNWTGNGTSTSKALSGLSTGTTYYWHVRSVNGGTTIYSNASSTAFWSFTVGGDSISPTVASIVRASANPTSAANVNFTVTFSEDVTDVNTSAPFEDFVLSTTGVTGASITGVTPLSASVYTVSVNTGSGTGTLRLDVPDTASINDLSGNPLSGLPFTSGEEYNIQKPVTYRSVGANDGWILESTETSTSGGTMNSTATTLWLGDDASDRQYRAILHFDTSSLPDTAEITSATLQLRKQSTSGTNPFTILGSLRVDARRPDFGLPTLELTDFRASAAKNNISTFNPTPVSNWYSAVFNSTGRLYINRTGTTQFKIYFTTGDNDDLGADLIKFYSGNAGAASRPKLVIEYYVP